MMHAPIGWCLWLGVVLLFGLMSLLKRRRGRPLHGSERHALGRLAASNVDRNSALALSGEVERPGRELELTAAALDEAIAAGCYAMALASHEPSFAPDAPVSRFDAGGPAHMGA